MNWKVIFQLSLLGLIMAVATVSLIPFNFEPFFWLAIFAICAYFIARVCTRKHFLHGFFLSVFNSVWIASVHYLFYNTYASHHPQIVNMVVNIYPQNSPKLAMLVMSLLLGAVSGLIQGAFSFIASKFIKSGASNLA